MVHLNLKQSMQTNNELLIRHDNRTGYQFSQFEADGFNNNDVITVTGIASILTGPIN